jgi:hypothetical protein
MFPFLANRDDVSVSKQKREAIAALLQENPQRSDRAIAKQANVSHHTVAKVRTEMEATGRTGQSAQSAVPSGRIGLDGKVRKISRGKVRAEIEANGEFSTELSGHKTRGRKPKPAAAVRDARGRFIRSPREPEARAEQVNRQPPGPADDSRPTSPAHRGAPGRAGGAGPLMPITVTRRPLEASEQPIQPAAGSPKRRLMVGPTPRAVGTAP